MKNEYIEIFVENLRNSDKLIILPIFYSGGSVSKDISSHDLADEIKKRGKNVDVLEREDIIRGMNNWSNYIIFGARDETLSDFANNIVNILRKNSTV